MKQKTQKFDCAKRMPQLQHSIPGKPFDIRNSEAAKWLCSQPEIMQYVFDKAVHPKGKGGFEYLEYNETSGTWQGINYGKGE